jgi:elongation factor 3
LCRELNPTEVDGKVGEVWRHHNLRLAYIAQHHMETLGKFYKSTPFQYLQHRYQNGYDEELQKHLLEPKDEEEALLRKELGKKYGKYGLSVGQLVGRTQKGKQLLYEIQWDGLTDQKQNTYESLDTLRKLGVEKFATACDARIQAAASGADQRMVSRREAIKHLEQFGIDEEMCCNREIGSFSAGQKSKLALGAAFWTKPHVVCLDEPTNYLDPETVSALARALKWFRGGVLVITHHQGFIDEVCNEAWKVGGGKLEIEMLENDNKRMA